MHCPTVITYAKVKWIIKNFNMKFFTKEDLKPYLAKDCEKNNALNIALDYLVYNNVILELKIKYVDGTSFTYYMVNNR